MSLGSSAEQVPARVCVIDTGIDWCHPDLPDPSEGITILRGEESGRGRDDDGHGTHCAGVIGALNNDCGVKGINGNVEVLSCKFLHPFGGYTSDAVACINSCTSKHNNATISSNSWGGGGDSQTLYEAIAFAGIDEPDLDKINVNPQHLFVAAAGKDGNNFDVGKLSFPAGYGSNLYTPSWPGLRKQDKYMYPPLSNIISVAAVDKNGNLPSWSNYGSTGVHIGAPGVSILSTVLNNGYESWSGTSMVCPHVSGAAALLKTAKPDASVADIKDAIMRSATPTPSLNGKTMTNGRLDVASALTHLMGAEKPPPSGKPGNGGGKPRKGKLVQITPNTST